MNIGEGVTAPVLVKKVFPVYPPDARLARKTGAVLLVLIIDAEGWVVSVEAINELAEPSLTDAAITAARQWRFAPARFDGRPVAVYATARVNFSPTRVAFATLGSGAVMLLSPTAPSEALAARDTLVTLAKTTKLGEVLEYLARNGGLRFTFAGDLGNDLVTVDWKHITVRAAIQDLAARYSLGVQVVDAQTLAISREVPRN
jgi:TonB family protein